MENSQNNILLAIVGSRCATNYGKLVIDKIIKELAPYNFTIVSGLALGIDTFSHQFAIKYHLKTVAVLGSGLDIIYPASNQNLYKSIIEKGGCIVSEYPLHIKPQEFRFPQRNRIISGLSSGILVVEARDKSGSLITARLGLEQNREIFAIPNSIFAKNSEGANKLIQQGAKLVLKGADILEEFNIQTNEILPNIS
ncbi:MAG TPA: DNA-processing protein DprA [Candidatus Paceibacterota bacterium]|nr:DNA-processing protein DprA [Candidatus Paceibacterota bacterium]